VELAINKVSLEHFLILAAVLFGIGVSGLLTNRKNVINILMSIELMLLASNINFVAFSVYFADLAGQVASIIILCIAAAEAAIGLAIVVVFFRNKHTIEIENLNQLKG
jgi:NADH-quinone oxidoreductase subunit K